MSRWTKIRPRTGRHLHVRSPLSRLEWGSYGRHRRRLRRGLVVAGVVVLVGAGVGSWFAFFRGNGTPAPSTSPAPACASAGLAGRLGSLAWVQGKRILVRDLDRCTNRVLATDGAPPVRFSPDGSKVGYGNGGGTAIVPVDRANGHLLSWTWGSSGTTFIGVESTGRVFLEQPGSAPQTLLTARGAADALIDPKSRNVAVGVRNHVEVVSAEGGGGKVVYSGPPKTTVKLAGWSPDGGWILFWDLADGATSGPLDAAPVTGTGYHNVFDPVPAFDDFVTWCGKTLVASGGGRQLVSEGQQLLVSSAPDWRTHNLSGDFRSSWIWPACSPDGRWIAVTLTPNHTERPPGDGERRVELISIDGKTRVRLKLGAGVWEVPRWSANGRDLLVVHRRRDPRSPAEAELVRFSFKTGKVLKTVEVGALGSTRTPLGHDEWTETSDWFRG